MICLPVLYLVSIAKIADATAGADYSGGVLGTGLHSLLTGPDISDQQHQSPETPTGPGYASAASMGVSPKKREYEMFGHADPHRGPDACPYGWFSYENSCYMLSSDEKPWVNAAIQCASMKAHLACIESADENSFLRELLIAMGVDRGAWHGLNELLHPGQETYGWGLTQQACTKYDWYGGEPVSPATGEYLCGMFFQAYHYHWHLGNCNQPNRYICEMKKGKPCECQL
ncbi:perlucin-like protein [Saccostrea cucullata]|uniref:perlucin-like protein n=1 Tax=Saccostrea cuccullata TaxID=36930 RepID=UPI002ED3A9EB